ncbi:hypothetical protein LB485_14475, partial [Staphylococcus aureus]|nr:hypothetical protein [Staphylococcus aureus]
LNLLHVLVGMVPAGILGLLFDDFIEEHLFSVPTVMIGLFSDENAITDRLYELSNHLLTINDIVPNKYDKLKEDIDQ